MKIAVCDDERACRETIISHLEHYNTSKMDWEITAFSRGEDLLKAYQDGELFDLIFLDAEMDGMSGVETGEAIREIDEDVLIIFVTSYTKYVSDAFRVQAFQYLIKPVKWEDFQMEMGRALEAIRKLKQLYYVKNKENESYIQVGNIMYIEVFNKMLHIHTVDDVYRMNGKLKEEAKKLENYGFIQCHKSFVVNMRFVKGIEHKHIQLKNKQMIPIGRTMREEILRKFNRYLGRRTL